MSVIDLFCGCGGLSYGFKQAGFNIDAAFDNWNSAVACYNQNFNDHKAEQLDLDICTNYNITVDTDAIDPKHDSIEVIKKFRPTIIIGGPPCQEFSNAGKRQEGEKANLTFAFALIVTTIKPDYFVMENVPRAQTSIAFQNARKLYRREGYGLTEIVLDASYCGVPQKRSRFFCIGHRSGNNGFLLGSLFANLGNQITFREYCEKNSFPLNVNEYYRHPTTYSRRAIFSVDEIAPTIRGVNRPRPSTYKWHPHDAVSEEMVNSVRHLNLMERAMIQTFPKDYNFEDLGISKADIEQLIGNAVPVNLAYYVASCMQKYMRGDNMVTETKFALWLRDNKSYSDRSISDVFCRINRANSFLPHKKINRYFLTDLEDVPDFLSLSTDVKSQIRKAIRLRISFDEISGNKNCDND